MKNALVIGYIGAGNPGDEMCSKILSRKLTESGIPHDILPVGASAERAFLNLGKNIRNASALIFSGGNLLQNRTSNRSLYFYLRALRLAKRYGVPVLFAACGIGEIYGVTHSARVASAISGVRFFGARTRHDLDYASSNCKGENLLMPDLCFTAQRYNGQKKNGFTYIPKYADENACSTVRELMDKLGYKATVIPFFKKEDITAAIKIADGAHAEIHDCQGYEEMMRILSESRFVITDRLHGAIFSLLCGTPVFISEREEKCRALTDEISLRCNSLGIQSPILPRSELCAEKIKELGALSSEFGLLLDNLKADTDTGIQRLIGCLMEFVSEN